MPYLILKPRVHAFPRRNPNLRNIEGLEYTGGSQIFEIISNWNDIYCMGQIFLWPYRQFLNPLVFFSPKYTCIPPLAQILIEILLANILHVCKFSTSILLFSYTLLSCLINNI